LLGCSFGFGGVFGFSGASSGALGFVLFFGVFFCFLFLLVCFFRGFWGGGVFFCRFFGFFLLLFLVGVFFVFFGFRVFFPGVLVWVGFFAFLFFFFGGGLDLFRFGFFFFFFFFFWWWVVFFFFFVPKLLYGPPAATNPCFNRPVLLTFQLAVHNFFRRVNLSPKQVVLSHLLTHPPPLIPFFLKAFHLLVFHRWPTTTPNDFRLPPKIPHPLLSSPTLKGSLVTPQCPIQLPMVFFRPSSPWKMLASVVVGAFDSLCNFLGSPWSLPTPRCFDGVGYQILALLVTLLPTFRVERMSAAFNPPPE